MDKCVKSIKFDMYLTGDGKIDFFNLLTRSLQEDAPIECSGYKLIIHQLNIAMPNPDTIEVSGNGYIT
jgi:hypothetical protein